jgi:formyltetrahydrofolate hydrolase
MEKTTAILLFSCPDQKGIVAAVSGFIARHNGNILDADQYSLQPENMLFMRVEWDLEGFYPWPRRTGGSDCPARETVRDAMEDPFLR